METKVWLITTKDVENLFNLSGKEIFFNLRYCNVYNISNYNDNENLTLIDYYSDYLNERNETVFYDGPSHRKSISDISYKIINSPNCEPSSSLFYKIFQLKGSHVFLTRSYPDKLILDAGNHIENEDQRRAYWLISYANTVAKIICKPFNEIEFYGILHSSDTNNSEQCMQFETISISRKDTVFPMIINRIKFSHDLNDYIYNEVILNTSFFSCVYGDDINNHILKSIVFPGIFERSKILEAAKLDFSKNEVIQFFLGCDEDQIKTTEDNFKKIFNKVKLEYL
jgi:hypothetical protein